MCRLANRLAGPGALQSLYKIRANFKQIAVKSTMQRPLKAFLVSGLTAAATLLTAAGAQAGVLNFYIFDNPANGGMASVKVEGSIQSTTTNTFDLDCATDGQSDLVLASGFSAQINFCAIAGTQVTLKDYLLDTPSLLNYFGSESGILNGGVIQGDNVYLFTPIGQPSYLNLPNGYGGGLINTLVNYSQTLNAAGFTGSGLIGTFTIGTTDTINVYLNSPPPSPSVSVPAPLPLLGASAALAFSRRFRSRLKSVH